jgi:hypothetical protein
MFVRKKTTKCGTVKHYLVENRRENGKVRQKMLHYLGDAATVEEAIAEASKRLAWYQGAIAKLRAEMEAAFLQWRQGEEERERKYYPGRKKSKIPSEPPHSRLGRCRSPYQRLLRTYWYSKHTVLRYESRIADLTNQLEKLKSVSCSAQR